MLGFALFTAIVYFGFAKEYKEEDEESVTQFLFKDIRERYPDAAKTLPDLSVENKDGSRNSSRAK